MMITNTPIAHPTRQAGFGWRFVLPVLAGPALNPINTSTIAVALVPISRDLHLPAATTIWLVAGLYLVSAVAQPTLGTLADRFGARRIYLAGLFVTLVAGALPMLWRSFAGVLAARLLIGLGTSACYPATLLLIRDRSAALHRSPPPALLSALSITAQATTAIGPVLGGVLVTAFGWRSVFLINVPLAAAALLLTIAGVPADSPSTSRAGARLDVPGIVLFATTMTSALFFLLHPQVRTAWLAGLAVAAAMALVLCERRVREPFLDVRMLRRNGPLTRTYGRQLLIYFGAYTMMYGFSQWLQDADGFAGEQVGWLQLPTALVAVGAGLLIARTERLRTPLIVAGAVPLIGGLVLAVLHPGAPVGTLIMVAALFGIPQGLASVANQAALFRQAPRAQLGAASGLARTAVYLGAILSSAVIGLTYPHAPTTAGLHGLGLTVAIAGALALLLALADHSLRRPHD